MKVRIIAGIAASVLLLLLVLYGPLSLMRGVVLIMATLSVLEFDRLFFAREKSRIRQFRVLIPVLLTLWVGQQYTSLSFWMSFIFFAIVHVCLANFENNFPDSLRRFSVELLGYIYTVGLFGFIMPIAEKGRFFLLLLFLIVFVGDTAAYFVGSAFGKHRLAVHVSPKKSVEGAAAAVVSSLIVAILWILFIAKAPWDSDFSLRIILSAPILSVLAQFGDLFESVLKRSQARKDSGAFLPGHGGVLDRLDGLLLAAPAYYFGILMSL